MLSKLTQKYFDEEKAQASSSFSFLLESDHHIEFDSLKLNLNTPQKNIPEQKEENKH